MTEQNIENEYLAQEAPVPQPDMQSLERLVGTWRQSGGVEGTITFEWTAGRFFLLQQVNLQRFGHPINGVEVIGHLQPFGEGPGAEIKSRFYSYTDGMTLDYVYELEGDTLVIWGGERGSPAYYKGQFSSDGDTLSGAWFYPGGGYESTAVRVK